MNSVIGNYFSIRGSGVNYYFGFFRNFIGDMGNGIGFG